jgi:transposase
MENQEVTMRAKIEETEGARRATGVSSIFAAPQQGGVGVVPDPEVTARATRRKFTAAYKRRILMEADACKEAGQIGALLRREGLYSSNLSNWRRLIEKGTTDALSSKKRGPVVHKPDPSARRIAELEKENRVLSGRLKKAELIIEAQKKIAEMFRTFSDQEEKNS